MIKEKLLKHQIEQVERAGYYVIPYDRVESLQAQYMHDVFMHDLAIDPEAIRDLSEKELLRRLACALRPYLRWTRTHDEKNMLTITRAGITIILPKKENSDEVPDSLSCLTDPLSRGAELRRPFAGPGAALRRQREVR